MYAVIEDTAVIQRIYSGHAAQIQRPYIEALYLRCIWVLPALFARFRGKMILGGRYRRPWWEEGWDKLPLEGR